MHTQQPMVELWRLMSAKAVTMVEASVPEVPLWEARLLVMAHTVVAVMVEPTVAKWALVTWLAVG